MAEEGYGLQISLKNGDDMFNARGADPDELLQILNALLDAADKDDMAVWIVKTFSIGEDRPAASSNGGYKRRSSGGGGSGSGMKNPDGEPSQKQLDFAKQLGIRNASRMTKAEVSEAIDARLAARDEGDDDD